MLPPLTPQSFELTLEQQLLLEQARRGVSAAPREELEKTLVSLFRLYLMQEKLIKTLTKKED